MTSIVRSVFSAAHRERPIAWRELFSPAFVESLDLAAVVSVFTAGLALVSAVALTFLGGV